MDIQPVKELDKGSVAHYHQVDIQSGISNQESELPLLKFSKEFAIRS